MQQANLPFQTLLAHVLLAQVLKYFFSQKKPKTSEIKKDSYKKNISPALCKHAP